MKAPACFLIALLLCLGAFSSADALLIDRGGGLIYDSDQDITWLQDANYAYTSGYWDTHFPGSQFGPGTMFWDYAMDWAAGLEYYDTVRGVTWDNWRLPVTPATTSGPTTEGEIGYLYGVYGVTASMPDMFVNLQPDVYWYGVEHPVHSVQAWRFNFADGEQHPIMKGNSDYAWAVMDGDVAAPIPEPSTMVLFGSSLAGLVAFRRKIKRLW